MCGPVAGAPAQKGGGDDEMTPKGRQTDPRRYDLPRLLPQTPGGGGSPRPCGRDGPCRATRGSVRGPQEARRSPTRQSAFPAPEGFNNQRVE